MSFRSAGCLDRCLQALPAALGSLVATVTVVDNASDDDSAAVARRHRGVRVVVNDENVGYARAMNQALAGSAAPILIALNPDTVPSPGSLAILVGVVRERPGVGLAAPRLVNPDGSMQHSVLRFPSVRLALVTGLCPPRLRVGRVGRRWWLEGYAAHDETAMIDWAIGAVHAIRAEALEDAKRPYPEASFMYGEDTALCWSLRERGWDVVLEPAARVEHVGGASSSLVWDAETRASRVLAET
ncbi:MAG: glycosyltransferase family 2 protein, partial [Acidimicrobiales bacterium]